MKSVDFAVQDPSAPPASEGFGTGRPPSSRRLAPGDVLAGKYELLALLGEGGMGTVWRAHSVVLDIDVAIKVLRGDHDEGAAADRLLREAQATAALGHQAIVRVFEFGETPSGEPFLVMERLEGLSLAEWLAQRGRLSAEQAVQMLLPIADGLVAAHAHGIIHRDIKPANIIAVPDREGAYNPKIVDFGIAKMARPGGQVLTEYGTVIGSVEYMSPEQADGRIVGEQSDVWALCVTLYELVTGRRPFEGRSAPAMLMALYTKTPVPTIELAAGDADLWAILARGLEKSPDERWPTMRALGQALATWATARGITVDAAGASIEHVWLGRTSGEWLPVGHTSVRPPAAALSSGPTLPPPSMKRSDTLSSPVSSGPDEHAPRSGSARVPSRRAQRVARVAACAFAALILVPLVGALGLRARGTGPGGLHTMAASAATMPSALAETLREPAPVAPFAEVPSPPAAVSVAAGPSASQRHRSKAATPPMPLPPYPASERMSRRLHRGFALPATTLILALSAGGCSLLIGSELSGKPAETTGAGGSGSGGESAATTSAGGSGSGGESAGAGGDAGPVGPGSGGGGPTCPKFTADCDGNPMHACDTDLKDDPRNCGACGVVCMPPHGCMGGKCQ